MRNWLLWYKKQVGFSGIRIDAIKHFPAYIAEDFYGTYNTEMDGLMEQTTCLLLESG